eukprot:TRINITY_DN2895_c0_g1_i1.p1 TRINITY_DN2895_c0_g1~~TRINITY_DN2895_c0_g1_i1.p1  ORF type:complete len:435 (-),score=125.90 TRINITY_DN2895_c0_g1_i1:74-1378(-)
MQSSKYSSKRNIPDEFPQIMMDFTREILRKLTYEDISNIYEFGASYFQALYNDEQAQGENILSRFSNNELESMIGELFMAADANGDGHLSWEEFSESLSSSSLGLSERMIRRLFLESDVNMDGKISYTEFAPTAVKLIELLVEQKPPARERKDFFDAPLHGYKRSQFQTILQKATEKYDSNLSFTAVRGILMESELGFTSVEIRHLMSEFKLNIGPLPTQRFITETFDTVLDSYIKGICTIPTSAKEILEKLEGMFEQLDTEKLGYLSLYSAKSGIHRLDYPLSNYQIDVILAETNIDEQGRITWRQHLNLIAQSIFSMIDMDYLIVRGELMNQFESQIPSKIHDFDENQFKVQFRDVMLASDSTQKGRISLREYQAALKACVIGFTPSEIILLNCAANMDDEVTVLIKNIENIAWNRVRALWLERQIQKQLNN